MNKNLCLLLAHLLLTLGIVATAAPANNQQYTMSFQTIGGSPAVTSGSFTYDSNSSTFTNFIVVWDGLSFDFTSTANSGISTNGNGSCQQNLTGGALTFALLTSCQGQTGLPLELHFQTNGASSVFSEYAGNNSWYQLILPPVYGTGSASQSPTSIRTSLTVQPLPTLSITNSPQVYTGSQKTATVTCSSGGAVSNIQYAASSTAPTNAGTYAVTSDCAANGNYAALTAASAGNFVISSATPTLSITNTPTAYTGSAIAAQVACLGGGTATVTNYSNGTNYNSANAPTAAGNYTVTANCAQSANYSAQNGLTASFVINAAVTQTPISNTALLTLAGMLALAGWWTMEQRQRA